MWVRHENLGHNRYYNPLTDWQTDWNNERLADWLPYCWQTWQIHWQTVYQNDWLTTTLTTRMNDWLTDCQNDWLADWPRNFVAHDHPWSVELFQLIEIFPVVNPRVSSLSSQHPLMEYRKCRNWGSWHTCSVFKRSRVRIAGKKPAFLNEYYLTFSMHPNNCWDSPLK
jgi:hypothetical protein